MKKTALGLKKIIILIVIAVFAMAMLACEGASAYDIAVKNGFKGSEAEWLETLKGQDGQDGINGTNGTNSEPLDIYDIYMQYAMENPDVSMTEFLDIYLSISYSETEVVAAKAFRSVVSIVSVFQQRIWNTTQDYMAAGAGVIYRLSDDTAYIITNYHVVYDRSSSTPNNIAKSISVFLYGQEYAEYAIEAEFVGGSMSKDIAVIRAESDSFTNGFVTAVDVADSNGVYAGSTAVAVGNPESEGISVTQGIVSVESENIEMTALNSTSATVWMRVMRIDTAVNGGNSGGGLFNSNGQLIGIVNAKTIDDGIENIAFAIPSNVACSIADSVLYNNSTKCVLNITSTIGEVNAVYNPSTQRVDILETIKVVEVSEESVAYDIIFADDIIESIVIDGESYALTRSFQLSDILYKVSAQDIIEFNIIRGGERILVDITITQDCMKAI